MQIVNVRRASLATVLATSLFASAPALGALAPKTALERVQGATGGAKHVLATSALLTGSIYAKGLPVTYYFRYGPTGAFGFQTPAVADPKPAERLKIGQSVSGLAPGTVYHFRLVIVGPEGTKVEKRERTLKTKGRSRGFVLPRTVVAIYGRPLLLSGSLQGTGNANQAIQLQASPFPYLESFTPIGRPGLTNALGAFSFRIANLLVSTQLRVVTIAPLPLFSQIIRVEVQPHVVLHVHSSAVRGLVRLYGTVAPALKGARVAFQVQKATRPHGRSEATTRWVTQFTTSLKKGRGNSSRFSIIQRIPTKGRYRAYVQLAGKAKALYPGPSTSTYVLQAAPAALLHSKR